MKAGRPGHRQGADDAWNFAKWILFLVKQRNLRKRIFPIEMRSAYRLMFSMRVSPHRQMNIHIDRDIEKTKKGESHVLNAVRSGNGRKRPASAGGNPGVRAGPESSRPAGGRCDGSADAEGVVSCVQRGHPEMSSGLLARAVDSGATAAQVTVIEDEKVLVRRPKNRYPNVTPRQSLAGELINEKKEKDTEGGGV